MQNIREILIDAETQYRSTGDTLFADSEYDSIVNYHNQNTNDKWNEFAVRPKDGEERLLYPMPSLNKIKDGDVIADLQRFMTRNPGSYLLSDKIDGTSLQIEFNNGQIKILTSGDGITGNNVSHIQEYISLPNLPGNYVIRGELTINKISFSELLPYLKGKGKKAERSRNTVNGVVNKKTIDTEILSKCVFVAFEVLSEPWGIEQQFQFLSEFFATPTPRLVSTPNASDFREFMSSYLTEREDQSEYEIDGIVVTSTTNYQHSQDNSAPEFAFAFKIDTFVTTRVTNVLWQVKSKVGKLTPIVYFEPTYIKGMKIKKATAHNAKFLVEKGIGIGSLITVTKGGEVIPKVCSCLEVRDVKVPDIPFIWGSSGVDIYVEDLALPAVTMAKMQNFVNYLKIDNIGPGNLEKFYNLGIRTIEKLARLKKDDIESIGNVLSEKIVNSIQTGIANATYPKIMAASGIFGSGYGLETFELLVTNFPTWEFDNLTAQQLLTIHGYGDVKSKMIAEKLPIFKEWISKNSDLRPANRSTVQNTTERDLIGQLVVFTGFREKTHPAIARDLQGRGAKISESWRVKCTLLIAANVTDTSEKITEAKNRGIPIMPLADYQNIKKYIKK